MIKLLSFQGALFSNMIVVENKMDYASKLLLSDNNLFDVEPTILPIPNDAPIDLPRVILKSKNGDFVCNTSLSRVDLFYNVKKDPECDLRNVKSKFFPLLINTINFLNDSYKIKINRIGLVSSFVLELSDSSNKYILQKYLNENGLISDTSEIQLNVLNRLELLSKYKINRWLRIRSLRDKPNVVNDKFCSVKIDINTPAEIAYDIDREVASLIFTEAIKNMEEVLKTHYGNI